jgi:hypothetical protein
LLKHNYTVQAGKVVQAELLAGQTLALLELLVGF